MPIWAFNDKGIRTLIITLFPHIIYIDKYFFYFCVPIKVLFAKKFFPLQFLLIFRKANAGELEAGSGLMDLFENMTEIDVDKEGVKGAKNFFQAKVSVAKIRMSFLVKKHK